MFNIFHAGVGFDPFMLKMYDNFFVEAFDAYDISQREFSLESTGFYEYAFLVVTYFTLDIRGCFQDYPMESGVIYRFENIAKGMHIKGIGHISVVSCQKDNDRVIVPGFESGSSFYAVHPGHINVQYRKIGSL